jgi:protoporphyrinogen/coproporphyrinogen III oxidase
MNPTRLAIIGGGISGLSFAHRVLEVKPSSAKIKISLFEAAPRLGGVIETEHERGFLMEKGADSFISEKPSGISLARRLGIESEIIGTSEAYRRVMICRNDRLIPVPEGFYLMGPTQLGPFLKSPLFSWRGKLRMAAERFIPASCWQEESVAGFIRRRFGAEALERAGQPLLAGIYTGDPEKLSLTATMPKFQQLEKRYCSVKRGLRMH